MKHLKRAGFITAATILLMFFTACGDRALVGAWVPEEVGRVPGNYPNKLELFRYGTGIVDGQRITWRTKKGNILACSLVCYHHYEISDTKLILSPDYGDGSVTYICAEEADARKEERARKEEEIRKQEAAAEEQAWKDAGASFDADMVFVEGGTFTMGCSPEEWNDCLDNEKPAHQVTLSDFYIGKYEVTQVQWVAVMGNNPSRFKGDNLPVENVSWDDVQEFIGRLNDKTGENYRLPTEAEWEYAARGGNRSMGYKYSGSNNVGDFSWYQGNSTDFALPVGTNRANELGIHDMSGNVIEWVSDYIGNYGNSSQMDPKGPARGQFRVLRGGGIQHAQYQRVFVRGGTEANIRFSFYGFRLARGSK